MRYALVACPTCRTPKGIETGHKTTQCNGCGKRLETAKLRRLATTDSIEGLQEALSRFHSEGEAPALASHDPASRSKGPPNDFEAILSRVPKRGGQAAAAEAVAKGLTELEGGFDEARFAEALQALGVPSDKTNAHLLRLLAAGLVVEQRPGRYRAL